MEALYAKLYDKYTFLKTKKFSELDQLNKDQEEKFVNYVAASEELINHLRGENERLMQDNHDLRSEVASIRSSMDEKNVDYEKQLLEANQKNRALSEEVARLQKLEQEGILRTSVVTPSRSEYTPTKSNQRSRRKRSRLSGGDKEDVVAPSNTNEAVIRQAAENLNMVSSSNVEQSGFCREVIDGSGDCASKSGCSSSLFQDLLQCLVKMKLTSINQAGGICVHALHQSTGYSFTLKWIDKAGEEPEILYCLLSLGTLEAVAPEWMRGDIMFSTDMCAVFFDRILRVITPYYHVEASISIPIGILI